ncbi:MAG: hypothetical protein KAU95_00760, partial [Candidatus Aenigmarchaeota archaeon]|nr:hypothetical protein [Candidatus Aenigmarchaeota archaeon]
MKKEKKKETEKRLTEAIAQLIVLAKLNNVEDIQSKAKRVVEKWRQKKTGKKIKKENLNNLYRKIADIYEGSGKIFLKFEEKYLK